MSGVVHKAGMKPSGISWLGDIPEGWEARKIFGLFIENVKKNSAFGVKRAMQFNYGTLVDKNESFDVEEVRDIYSKYTMLNKDDIVINGLNLNYDIVSQRVAISPKDGIITAAYIAMSPREGVYSRYFCYLFKGMDARKMFHGMGSGIRLTLSFKELRNQNLPLPPFSEQEAIVAYLDDATGKIDKAIAAEERMIALLQERREIVINEAVSGSGKCGSEGVDFNTEAQRRRVRRGWEVKKLFYIFEGFGSGTTPRVTTGGGNVPWVNSGDLNYSYLTSVGKFVDEFTLKSNTALRLYPKDSIIIAMYGASIGKVSISKIDGFCTNQACQVLFKPRSGVKLRYVFYFLLTCKKKWTESSQGGTQPNINADIIKQTRIPLPPLSEQEEIVKYLDAETGKIDRAIEVKRRQIELLRERRQIVIDEAVTGKVRVA